ncbi:uncharacterized protein BBA_06443 [Beauveria bassiana ARSEF 2860]|uniref:Uncharacterized protein n=1 Tax=Beauveria bassiana (strain ARSEF 2860) TaxID=655819 RepID=J4KMS2_BEAB2|nr:uncharacterized protein BBA_06443 [Beauveria bassiana ARSEF 2860]EJP64449.1 hypothetical protein BBA_06443 [Beauveria bassiana ARSEF 2860]
MLELTVTPPRPPHAEIALENDDKEKRTFEKKSAKRVGRNDDSNADASDSASPKRKAFRGFQKPFYLSESPFCVRERSIGMCSETRARKAAMVLGEHNVRPPKQRVQSRERMIVERVERLIRWLLATFSSRLTKVLMVVHEAGMCQHLNQIDSL